MSQNCEGNIKTFTAAEALEAFRRVRLDSSGNVVYSDSGETWIGTTEHYAANAAQVSIRLRTASGTRKVTAAGAFSINALLYGADDGKVDDAVAGSPTLRALEAATANNDVIEAIDEEGVDVAGDSFIWVSPNGDDSGDGSFTSPYLTITKAFTQVTAVRPIVMVMPGEYAEVDLVWPNINGVRLIAPFGSVLIGQSTKAATAVITMAPTTATSTWEAYISEGIDIESDYTGGTCLAIANADITKKMVIQVDADLSTKAVTDKSVTITNTVSSAAIRVYAAGNFPTWEGTVTFVALNASDRLRVYNHRIIGAITQTGAVAVELTFINSAIPTVTKTSEAALNNINCWHETDADPDVYTAYTNAYDT
ncbi:MAG: DUF1565 domain-containing protein [Sedimentisphaerales bacterium]